MEHLGHELDVGGFGGVLLSELQFQFKETPVPGRSLWSLDEGRPLIEIALLGGSIDALILLVTKFLKVSDEPLLSWVCHSKPN